ncbi:hypothetical protein UCDDS831_g07752 [Diplodia seriata]|uniref:Dihydroorotate dehydrogenase n=1 Tax=Diplodia seriata TaxID=420778 RepID=A0A0G2DYK7_9PEZI|nr:hypothetical protein UCDDS831_g07752 [Diplodia seriata]
MANHNHPTTAYKILTAPQWAGWQQHPRGLFAGAGIDLADGYIHLSTASTAGETFDRYFADLSDLVVVEVDLTQLGDAVVKWEESRGGALFPHVYGKGGIPLGAVKRRWEGGENFRLDE